MGDFDGWEKNPRMVEAVRQAEAAGRYVVAADVAEPGEDRHVEMMMARQAEGFELLRLATSRPGQRMLWAIETEPMGKPRMTIGDRKRAGKEPRPVVARWHRFKSLLIAEATAQHFELPNTFEAIFFIPIPSPAYEERIGHIHQMKPDTDNLLKGLKDALAAEDSYIWRDCASKYWTAPGAGRIEIWTL